MNENLLSWMKDVAAAPNFYLWSGILGVVFVFGVLLFFSGILRRRRDGARLRQLIKIRWGEDLDGIGFGRDLPSGPGAVGIWVGVLKSRQRANLPTKSSDLGVVVSGVYDGLGSWIGYLRSTALMVGLLFTFIGLGLALKDLAAALQMTAGQTSADVGELMSKVRACLPSLAMAFGSSVAGVIASVVLGFLESFLHVVRDGLEAKLSTLSLEWLEGRLAPVGGHDAVAKFTTIVQEMSEVLSNVTRQHSSTAELLRSGLTRMDSVVSSLSGSTASTLTAVSSMQIAAEHIAGQVTETVEALREAAATNHMIIDTSRQTSHTVVEVSRQVEALLTASAERLVHVQEHAATQLNAVTATMADLNAASAHLASTIGAATERLDGHLSLVAETAESMVDDAKDTSEITKKLVHDLSVSAKHVQGLTRAASAFESAQQTTQDTVNSAQFFQKQMLEELKRTFDEVPRMTEAITGIAVQQRMGAERLSSILNSDDMHRYLKELPRLVELAEAEGESRRVLRDAVDSFHGLNDTLEDFRDQMNRIGHAAESLTAVADDMVTHGVRQDAAYQTVLDQFSARYEALVQELGTLAERSLPGPVRAVVKAAVEPQAEYIIQLGRHVEQLSATTREFTGETKKVQTELREVRDQLATPSWRRLLGLSSQKVK